ncbi:transcription factor VBP-like isoform X2 [Mizuhopecten yessoensis]|uniref:Thyrotroph embryonic factor n=1 Tax=Mizuhopecten yessoensis TaxID=6573 RepID=A0A210PVV2_MIZYE|nr:transcription factor VBP-like isoform X2 [Mizuhopecten yessoensis]OWF40604.1 Thyrotroph embryonic factor [Mizuhopecten yessoensis]
MAEDAFCDFPPDLDPSLLSQMSNYAIRHNEENENFEGSAGRKHNGGPGFYMDQYAANMEGVAVPMMNMSTTHSGPGMPTSSQMSSTASTAAAGSPQNNKNMLAAHMQQGAMTMSVAAMVAASQQHMLAKPVPMRRLSDKNISPARANFNYANPVDTFLTESMLGQAAVAAAGSSPTLARALAAVQQTQKRPRSEKKAFPLEQKDGKYFERRKRNNLAAKKSRDARKSREDDISIRASFLEKENAILRAQVATLREEANSLKQLLLQKRSKH